jgi:hypothetical protein
VRRFSPFTRRNRSSTASTLPKISDLEPSQVEGLTVSLQAATTKLADLTWLKLVRTAVVDAGEGIAEVVG